MGTRMTGHPDIEPISKVTTGEGSEALLLATPPASWAGGGGPLLGGRPYQESLPAVLVT